MTNEIKVKKELKVIIDSIVEKMEKEYEVFICQLIQSLKQYIA